MDSSLDRSSYSQFIKRIAVNLNVLNIYIIDSRVEEIVHRKISFLPINN